ncbi:MAG: methyltransferase [Planctomycetes bacterium]|nr:methyltransferase [Planctomycetota bacterium]
MNSRERILAAIDHREPDRVPVDFGSNPSSGISALAYNKLKKHLRLAGGHTLVYDVMQQLARPEDELLDRFGVDVIDVDRALFGANENWIDVRLADGGTGQFPSWFKPVRQKDGGVEVEVEGKTIARMLPGGMSFDQVFFPYLDRYPDTFADLPEVMDMVQWGYKQVSSGDLLRDIAIKLSGGSDRAITIGCDCSLFEWGSSLRRQDNFLMDLLAEQKKVETLLDALMEIHLAKLGKICAAVGDCVDIVRFSDDLGMTTGPIMSPAIYRKLFKPRHTIMNETVHKLTEMKTFLHSCGSICALLPDLIEAGFDIINPVQVNCQEMEPRRLKDEFGSDITFWGGGCDDAEVMNHGSVAQVKKHVFETLDIFAPGGGYIFSTVHNILPETPPQNILAIFEAVAEFNRK